MKTAIQALATLFAIGVAADPLQRTFTTKLDHFNASRADTFTMRYIVDDQYWNTHAADKKPGPILFYAGNEGSVWDFYKNSGFMTKTLAQEFGGLVVAGEHRFFGESFPFDKSTAFTYPNNTFLTIENTMMDYVKLIKQIKNDYNAHDKAVIVFGGSYGGMLASWIRMKYPATFQGALAASAPILSFKGAPSAPETGFDDVITNAFETVYENKTCSSGIKEAFAVIDSFREKDDDAWKFFQDTLKLCKPLAETQDVLNLYQHFKAGFEYMVMTDYPYASDFLQPMPAWPVNASCVPFAGIAPPSSEDLKEAKLGAITDRQKQMITALKAASDVYFNSSGQISCTDFDDTEATGSLAAEGWNVLACNQLAMPMSNGDNTLFNKTTFDYDGYTAYCKAKYGLEPNYQYALYEYGGFNETWDFKPMKNIIFSNGNIDPWNAGGVKEFINFDLPTFMIRGGAHHLDLREPNDADGDDVKWVRKQEMDIIARWINDYQNTFPSNPDPAPIDPSFDSFL